MIPYDHQLKFASLGFDVLTENMICYLAMEERTGKTLTSILICERSKIKSILVITKKKALEGWNDTLAQYKHKKSYTVTNYHQVSKLKATDYDLVIMDEAHNYISAFPKPGKIWHEVLPLCKGKPIIYLSATPHAQGMQLLYHQLGLSDWSPLREYRTGYEFHRAFGIPDLVYLAGRQFESYKKVKTEEVKALVDHLFVTATRAELDFEHEPEDKLHYIELDTLTKSAYNYLMKHKVIEVQGTDLVCDTPGKLRTSLHMLEGGVAKIENDYLVLENEEKIRYIKEYFGDSADVVIMYNFKAEATKLNNAFILASILQATSFAEGIDLSSYKHLIIYSQDYSTARHSQRRARQANIERAEPIIVHYLLVKKAISEQVYKTVSINKVNFIDSVFKRVEL